MAVALLTLLFAGPLTALLASFGLGLGTLLMSMALMRWTGWHFAPAAALLGLVLAFGCAVTWAVYSVLSRRLGAVPTASVTIFCLATAVLSMVA